MATETSFIQFAEGTAAPSTPAATKWRQYFKTDGMYYVDDAGLEVGPLAAAVAGATVPVPWSLIPDSGSQVANDLSLGAANRCIFVPATLMADATITGCRIVVFTQSGNISVALYDDAGTQVATSGSVACPAAGRRDVSFTGNYAATAGRYYLALSASSLTAIFGAVAADTTAGTTSPMGRYQETAHPAPATATFAGETNNTPVIIGRVSGGYP